MPSNQSAQPEPPKTELEEIQIQTNRVQNDSLESTRRMVQMMEESKEAGIKTLVMLDEQGEQLDRIEEGADRINQEMKEAEKNLEGLEGCCGLCVLPWQRSGNFEKGEDYNKTWKASEDGKLNANGPRRIIGDTGPATKGFVNRITNDAREDEMDENLVQVSSMIGNLRNMAIDMGTEIENQNQLIGRVQKKTESNTTRIEGANKRANKLLKT
jgi:synaptosomal-associated protein 25